MRAVVQRVRRARVTADAEVVMEMGSGLLALVGVAREDDASAAQALAHRLVHLRVLPDPAGRLNESLASRGGTLGLVSQFTLLGDARAGRRPSYARAAPAAQAEPLLESLAQAVRASGVAVATGRFGARMDVELVNEGPVTILLDTDRTF